MKPKAKVVWLAAVDGAHARFFALDHAGETLKLVPRGALEGTRAKTHDLVTDHPGRTHESVGTMRHAKEPRTDPKEHAEEVFTATVARELIAFGKKGAFDELIIVSSPKRLGDLRRDVDPHFREKFVVQEIPGDWTNMTPDEIAEHLRLHFDHAGRLIPYAKPERQHP